MKGRDKGYKIRWSRFGKDKKHRVASITIPSDIADMLPEDIKFECELTDDGLLYSPIKQQTKPSWAGG